MNDKELYDYLHSMSKKSAVLRCVKPKRVKIANSELQTISDSSSSMNWKSVDLMAARKKSICSFAVAVFRQSRPAYLLSKPASEGR